MHVNKEAFISDLSYEIPDDAPWEIDAEGLGMGEYILPKLINVTMTLKLVETVGSTYQMATGERKAVAEGKTADGKVVPAVPAAPAIAASAKRLYGYGASNPNQILNEDRIKNLDKGGDPIKQTQVSDSPNASTAEKPENPVAEAPKQKIGPNGIFVEKYKDLNIYKKPKGGNFVYIVRDGEQPLHAGPEGRREDELLSYERKWIDNFVDGPSR
jgi:hypothetical protein